MPPKAGDSSGDRQNQAAFVSSIHSPGQIGLNLLSQGLPAYPLHPASSWEKWDLFSLQLGENSREGLHVHTLTDAWCVSICVHLLQLSTERKYLYEYKSMFPSEHYEKECLLLQTEIQNNPFWI